MVIDYKRLLTGFTLVFFIFTSYIFEIELILILTIVLVSFLELYKSNLINLNKLLSIYILYFIIIFLDNSLIDRLLILIFFILCPLTLYLSKFKLFFFVISIITSLYFFIQLSLDNRTLFYLCIFISFFNDTLAYIFGNLFKGPKIIPNISPNKTWSGTILYFIFSYIILSFFFFDIYLSIILSLFLFLGDIYFSFFKRFLKIKDFSAILPVHGGFFDRYDSIFFLPIIISIFYL